MKRSLTILAFLTSFSCVSANAFENFNVFPGEANVEHCYGYAMVGMDSVINSRLGVPVERAVELARIRSRSLPVTDTDHFSTELLENMLTAYMWEGSPHSYAIRVFYRCAQNSTPLRSAATESDAVGAP